MELYIVGKKVAFFGLLVLYAHVLRLFAQKFLYIS